MLNQKKLDTLLMNQHGYIRKEGAKSVTNSTVTELDRLPTLDDGKWIIMADVWMATGGSASATLQARLYYDGLYVTRGVGDTSLHIQNVIAVDGGQPTLFETYQTTGATKSVNYTLTAIKVG